MKELENGIKSLENSIKSNEEALKSDEELLKKAEEGIANNGKILAELVKETKLFHRRSNFVMSIFFGLVGALLGAIIGYFLF